MGWLLLVLLAACAQTPITEGPSEKVSQATSDIVVLDHSYYSIQYSKTFRLPRVVRYVLLAENLRRKTAKRRDGFAPDPILTRLKLNPVKPKEYSASGYDKGHMAPSADFAWSQEGNDATFLMSNMAPQKPGLNRDAWRRLEEKVREWACGEGRVIVFTGPLFEANMSTLKSGLSIPKAFFKVLIDDTPPRKALAFIYYQEDKGDILDERLATMEKIESRIGVPLLEEFQEEDRAVFHGEPSPKSWKAAKCSISSPSTTSEIAKKHKSDARPR